MMQICVDNPVHIWFLLRMHNECATLESYVR